MQWGNTIPTWTCSLTFLRHTRTFKSTTWAQFLICMNQGKSTSDDRRIKMIPAWSAAWTTSPTTTSLWFRRSSKWLKMKRQRQGCSYNQIRPPQLRWRLNNFWKTLDRRTDRKTCKTFILLPLCKTRIIFRRPSAWICNSQTTSSSNRCPKWFWSIRSTYSTWLKTPRQQTCSIPTWLNRIWTRYPTRCSLKNSWWCCSSRWTTTP